MTTARSTPFEPTLQPKPEEASMHQHPFESQPAAPMSGQTPGTDHVRSEDNNLTVILGEWGFKALFGFLGAAATLLSLLAPRRQERS
jgi:hypothetical protein